MVLASLIHYPDRMIRNHPNYDDADAPPPKRPDQGR